MGIKQIGRQDC